MKLNPPPSFPSGVIPACILPFREDLSIDEESFQRHLSDLAAVDGISAITINGHSCEVHALTHDEQRRTLAVAKEAVGETTKIVTGIFSDSSLEAARLAKMATLEGSDCLLVFPPQSLALGGYMRPEMILEHFRRITDQSDLPIILFQYPPVSAISYPLDTLLKLCEKFPTIKAIKDWCGDPAEHERNVRVLHALTRQVNVLTTHSMWLLSSLVLGCRGILSGAGSVIAALQVDLFRAIQKNDLDEARRVSDRIYPTVRAFYSAPLVDMHNRMKEALVLLGKLDGAYVRPPLMKLPPDEIKRVKVLLAEAGLIA
jgi:4-hydroxy-tetrahydrodipicolinate synthase